MTNANQKNLQMPNWGESKLWQYKGMKVLYRVSGEKGLKPMVLIHGFGASSEHWRKNAYQFSSHGYRVYGIDLIGFGKSEQNLPDKIKYLDNLFWSQQTITFLEEVVDIKKFGKAILIGNSLGGLTAITTGSIRPDLIEAIVAAPLPDPAFMDLLTFDKPRWFKILEKNLLNLLLSFIPFQAIINLISRTNLIKVALQGAYKQSIKNDYQLLKIVKDPSLRPNAGKALKAMCLGMSLRPNKIKAPNLLKRLGENLQRPQILLIWGREDKLVPFLLAKKLITMHPWLKLLVLENAGHCPHDELPNYFNRYVLKWLEINLTANS